MAAVEETALAYFAAWAEADEEQRRALLEHCWAENGLYTTPTREVAGREALVQHIGGFQRRFAGHRILITSGVDGHHDRLRYSWAWVDAEGQPVLEGFDVGEIGSDGRLIRITEFFRPSPAVPASWPPQLAR